MFARAAAPLAQRADRGWAHPAPACSRPSSATLQQQPGLACGHDPATQPPPRHQLLQVHCGPGRDRAGWGLPVPRRQRLLQVPLAGGGARSGPGWARRYMARQRSSSRGSGEQGAAAAKRASRPASPARPCARRENRTHASAHFKGFLNVPARDERALMEAVHRHGPIAISIDAALDTFKFYSEGVYRWAQGPGPLLAPGLGPRAATGSAWPPRRRGERRSWCADAWRSGRRRAGAARRRVASWPRGAEAAPGGALQLRLARRCPRRWLNT
jgi:hypothetical protein